MNEHSLVSSTPRRVRQTNELVVLRALRRFGALSRAELARMMGLNRSSSGHIIAELISSGLVREEQTDPRAVPGTSSRGRPGIMIALIPEAAYFMGIEIGVKHITTTIIDMSAAIVAITKEANESSAKPVEEVIEQAVKQAFANLSEDMSEKLEGVGFSVPAQMNAEGFIFNAPLLQWTNINFIELAKRALPVDLPVSVENDANAFAIGELYRSNVNRGVVLFLVIESGVGGGLLIDGRLFRGGNGLAGEIGHLIVKDVGNGEPHTLEKLIGLERLLAQYRSITGKETLLLHDFLNDVEDREPSAVLLADQWAKHLSFALVQACRIVDPNRIVLGGSLAALYKLVSARVATYIGHYQDTPFPVPEIVLDESAESGSAFGAACMLHQRFLSLENTTPK